MKTKFIAVGVLLLFLSEHAAHGDTRIGAAIHGFLWDCQGLNCTCTFGTSAPTTWNGLYYSTCVIGSSINAEGEVSGPNIGGGGSRARQDACESVCRQASPFGAVIRSIVATPSGSLQCSRALGFDGYPIRCLVK